MTEYFTIKDYEQARATRKKILGLYYGILAIFVGVTAGLFIYYTTLPYKAPIISTIKLIQHVLSFLFVVFSFVYLGIVFKRTNKYYKLTKNLVEGLKETSTASFFEYKDEITIKDGVDFKSLVFIEWNKYKNDYYERNVLVFKERPFPEIPEKAMVSFVTQGNVLIKYEILEQEKESE